MCQCDDDEVSPGHPISSTASLEAREASLWSVIKRVQLENLENRAARERMEMVNSRLLLELKDAKSRMRNVEAANAKLQKKQLLVQKRLSTVEARCVEGVRPWFADACRC